MEDIVVGIDLGTTFSAVAYVDDRGDPRVIPNAEGQMTMPSVVLIDTGRVVVGSVAMNQWVTRWEHVVRWIKRAMGDSDYRFQNMSAVEISAEILKALKTDAEAALGQPLGEAVITCPAYFAAVEIESTKKAGELAGFRVREIVKEPTAAAVYFGIEHMREGEKVLVCDLGGGTYDATILALDHGNFTPLASMGDRRLGGHDWTMELVEMAGERLTDLLGDDPRNDLVAGQMLYEACEQAKRDFSRVSEVAIPCAFRGRMEQIRVTRAEFEARTEWRMQQVVMWSERAIEKAGLAWKHVDRILMVGGSSRLTRMAPALAATSGKTPIQVREPDLAVALGAAIIGRGKVRRRVVGGLTEVSRGGLTEVPVKRIIARSLGTRVIVLDGDKARVGNALLIPHSTEIPVSRARDDFEVSFDGQPHFDVPVVEFESDDDFDVVGNFRFTCRPGARRADRITVTFHYDINGIPTVDAVDQCSKSPLAVARLPFEEPDLEAAVRARVRPRWVVFAVDVSYSMDGVKIATARQAVLENARRLLAAGGDACRVGIVTFASSVTVVCRPTSDVTTIEAAVQSITASGTTAMDDGIRRAVELVMTAPAGADRDVVMVTDGVPDDARRDGTLRAATEARAQGVTLSSLGLGKGDVDVEFLTKLSPISLVIERVDEMSGAVTTLLTQSAATRGGLREESRGGLRDAEG